MAIELPKTNLSGTRLLPGWREEEGHPFKTEVKDGQFLLLGPAGSIRLPNFAQEYRLQPGGITNNSVREMLWHWDTSRFFNWVKDMER